MHPLLALLPVIAFIALYVIQRKKSEFVLYQKLKGSDMNIIEVMDYKSLTYDALPKLVEKEWMEYRKPRGRFHWTDLKRVTTSESSNYRWFILDYLPFARHKVKEIGNNKGRI